MLHKQVGDIYPADTGMVLPGAEELMSLFDQLPAQLQAFVHKEHLNSQRGRGIGGCQSSWASAYNQELGCYHFSSPPVAGWRLTSIPSTSGSTQVRTLALPLTVIRQEEHLPMAQKKPRGRLWCLL
jgi:hypothetical protein